MSPSPTQIRPRVGRDPNDATWRIVRYPTDWAAAALEDAHFDPLRGVLELASVGSTDTSTDTLADVDLARPVTDAAGVIYQSDPSAHVLRRKGPCDQAFATIAGIGGFGWQTGWLARPLGLAIDPRGFLLVADAGNHRVDVVRIDPDGRAEVVLTLGATDEWGRPVSGLDGGAMTEPVAVAVDECGGAIYVADRAAGKLHVFDIQFRWRDSVTPAPDLPRPAGAEPRPVAISARAGVLYVFDASWPHVLFLRPDGAPVPFPQDDAQGGAADLQARADALMDGLPAGVRPRFAAVGQAVIGPLDSDVEDTLWHRVLVDARTPSDTRIEVQTYADDDDTIDPATIPWAPEVPVPLTGPDVHDDVDDDVDDDERARLVLSDTGRWERYQGNPHRRARPVIARYDSDGPAPGDPLRLSAAALRLVRAGDSVELTHGAASEPATLGDVPARTVRLAWRGAVQLYGPGTEVYLVARTGVPPKGGARLLHQFGAGESADPTGLGPSLVGDVELPHGAGASLRRGDVVELRAGTDSARFDVREIDLDSRLDSRLFAQDVPLAAPLIGDFSTGEARLLDTPGRLLTADTRGFEQTLPARESIDVLSAGASSAARIHRAEADLSEPAPAGRQPATLIALWLEPGSLIAPVTFENWTALEAPAPRGTDRGRYLWIRIRLFGGDRTPARDGGLARLTPAVRSVRALLPRLSYTEYLPAVFQRRDDRLDPSGDLFISRFLALFEGALTRVEEAYESVSRLLNPEAADAEWLAFVACWLDLVFDPSWPLARRRALVLEAAALYRRRGTPESLRRYLEIYTGRRPEIIEAFQLRSQSVPVVGHPDGAVLGVSTLPATSVDDQPTAAATDALLAAHAHRFILFAYLDDPCDRERVESTVRHIVTTVAPAHTDWDLQFVLPDTRVGLQSTVGIDMVLGGPAGQDPDPTILGQDVTADGLPRSILGRNSVIGPGADSGPRRASPLSSDGPPTLGPAGDSLNWNLVLE